jgi:hypothetical protein
MAPTVRDVGQSAKRRAGRRGMRKFPPVAQVPEPR